MELVRLEDRLEGVAEWVVPAPGLVPGVTACAPTAEKNYLTSRVYTVFQYELSQVWYPDGQIVG